MTMRFGNGLSPLIELIDILKDLKNRLKTKRGCLDLVMQIVDLSGCIFDNWVYLKRIGLVNYTSQWQKDYVDWMSSLCTVSFIIMSIIMKAAKTWVATMTQYKQLQ